MRSAKQQKQSERMQKVASLARLFFALSIASTQSEAMTFAWAKVKAMEAIEAGKPLQFIKKSTGELRIVQRPAKFVSTGGGATTTNRAPQPQLIIFLDLDKVGHNTISCDVRTLVK